MEKHPERVTYILSMFKAMEYSFSASFNMLCFYMTEQEAFNILAKTKNEMKKGLTSK